MYRGDRSCACVFILSILLFLGILLLFTTHQSSTTTLNRSMLRYGSLVQDSFATISSEISALNGRVGTLTSSSTSISATWPATLTATFVVTTSADVSGACDPIDGLTGRAQCPTLRVAIEAVNV